ncbi:glutamate receptor interacting protein isoform X3 [Cotesia typhae]|uniref:glutamate receptor interacting protein isoform X3 n=1 Tax=Cotesia typhae TaxID=2053667 RepID=UPI003D681E36
MSRMFGLLKFETVRSREKCQVCPENVATINSSLTHTNENTKSSHYEISQFLVLDNIDMDNSLSFIRVFSKVTQVRVKRENGFLGVTLRGGEATPLIITGIKPDGPTAREGRVRLGDKLLAIDDIELQGLSLFEARNVLKRNSNYPIASLTIEYNVASMAEVRTAISGPLLIELNHTCPGELGLKVRNNANGVYIESLRPASAADRCGAIQPGDKLLAVDDTPINDTITAMKVLKNISKTYQMVKIQILPQILSTSMKTLMKKSKSQQLFGVDKTIFIEENLTVILKSDHQGFGFVVKLSNDGMNYVIDHIEAGSPAERCGVLLPDDRILAMNQKILRNLQLNEITAILESSQNFFCLCDLDHYKGWNHVNQGALFD